MESDYLLILRLSLFLGIFVLSNSQEECQRGGCFPATGDLLVGRQHKLKSTSTCGLNGPEKYCIVSFLDKRDKCFICDTRNSVDRDNSNTGSHRTSHLIKYVVTNYPQDRLKGWWQSENGQQEVTLQLDLEVEFVFTHLIMTFKTFRPKAMYVERSWNYGRDWSDYRYFAYDCAKSFPKVQRGPQRKIDDVICEERYSRVEPSTEGEVVMKVLDPIIQRSEDPYSLRVQNLLKLTNLRIHFKELHTFGDDVLGDSPEVNRKYYYALYEMVVRGSCSCYGHADQCIPAEGTKSNVNMVHGNCDCKHFTTGRNCERCMDGYNDEPWRPAYKDQLNVCRKCNCNSHTEICHFDPAVYNATGHSSGGVCDDCNHNTAGRQCEQCKPLFYRDPYRDITDPLVCRPCDCDPAGSFGGGECENLEGESREPTEAGRCICKGNVVGRRCDRCKDGFWNLLESNPEGCQSCKCDKRGTVERDTCDQKTGVCRCKRNVRGLTCSQCLEGYWNLGNTPEGCQPCGCDPGGSKNLTCDVITGQCSCRPHLMGRKCDKVRPGYHFANLDHTLYEGENTLPGRSGSTGDFQVIRKIAHDKGVRDWTGDGFIKVKQGSIVDFSDVRVPKTGDYNLVLRYDTLDSGHWSDVRVTVEKTYGERMGGDGCPTDSTKQVYIYPVLTKDKKGKELEPSICFSKGSSYRVKIDFRTNDGGGDADTLVDSLVLLPNPSKLPIFEERSAEAYQRKQIYEKNQCRQYYIMANNAENVPDVCKKIQFSISSMHHNGGLSCECDPIGTKSNGSRGLTCQEAGGQCPCKPGVTGRRCDSCATGYFGFGRYGCTACACNTTGSTSEFCDESSGQCACRPQIQGRKCDSCPPFHFGFPYCKRCECNRHSETCNPASGQCTNCRHNTAGLRCNVCADGYYGEATQGTETDCQRCQCPGGSSGNQFSPTCVNSNGGSICNACVPGYMGNHCEKCQDGYFGNPLIRGGSCNKCDCSGNIDPFADGKCDAVTGECFNCINNAEGGNCERCKPGYFGEARNQTCRACVCNELGTDPNKRRACNQVSGQCQCLPNVEGTECDKCVAGYYNIASGKGCLACGCHKKGSLEGSCNQLDGQCRCRVGFGGRDCSECENFSWGDPMQGTCEDNIVWGGDNDISSSPTGTRWGGDGGISSSPTGTRGGGDGGISSSPTGTRRGGDGGISSSPTGTRRGGDGGISSRPTQRRRGGACGCNPRGSISLQCDRRTGKCKCRDDVVGDKCDMCAPRTAGVMPKCEKCHVCNDQWEDIVSELERKVTDLMKITVNVTINATSITLYTKEVEALKSQLRMIESMFTDHLVQSDNVREFVENMREFRKNLNNMTKKIEKINKVVKRTTRKTDNINKELDTLDLTIDELQRKAKEFKINVTKAIEGNIGGALNSTRESLKRSQAAQVVVQSAKKVGKKSKLARKKIKKEIINGEPTFEKLDKDNNKVVDQLDIDVSDLEKKLKQLNRLLCGKGCGGCKSDGCDTCGVTDDCTGVKQMAKDAMEKAKMALEMAKKKRGNAQVVLQAVEGVEAQVNRTFYATEDAEKVSKEVKAKSENTKKKIIKLIKDIEDFLKVKFFSPSDSRMIARETIGLNISLTPEEVRILAEKIRAAVKNLTNVENILKESETDLNDALRLKEDAEKAKKFAIDVMNKTQKVLDDLARTRDLQNSTTRELETTKKTLGEADDILNQIKAKLKVAGDELKKADEDANRTKEASDEINKQFDKNRENLRKAEDNYRDAKEMTEQVDGTTTVVKNKYNMVKKKLDEKKQGLDDVINRINALDRRAGSSMSNVIRKVQILDELKKRYSENEKRTNDLSMELRRLAIKAKFIRNRIKELAKCHSTCNPQLTQDICTNQLKAVDAAEKSELSAITTESSRSTTV